MPESPQQPDSSELTDKQQRFIEEYCVDTNKAAAARRAGYEPEYARQIGHENYTKPYIRAAIDARLAEMAMPADVAIKMTADIAATRLNDFMVVRQVQGYEQRLATLQELVDQKEGEIDFVREFLNRKGLYSEEQQKPFAEKLVKLRQELLDYLLEMEVHGPDATKLVAGKPVVHEVADLDLVALARAKDTGRLKSYKVTKEGVQVEMLDAQGAIRDILKMAGKFITKVEVTDTTPIKYDELSDETIADILRATRPKSE